LHPNRLAVPIFAALLLCGAAPFRSATHLRAAQPLVPAAVGDTVAYAGGQRWFVENEALTFGGRRWVKFGLTRTLTVTEAVRVGEFRGVSVFRSTADGTAKVLYVAVRAGCEFQPYRPEDEVHRVRG
jgi:hypothetical protein